MGFEHGHSHILIERASAADGINQHQGSLSRVAHSGVPDPGDARCPALAHRAPASGHHFRHNLRGPGAPVSFLGSAVSEVIPVNAVTGNVAVAFAALSYAGTLTITVTADADAFRESGVLAAALQDELDAVTQCRHAPPGCPRAQ
jgi:hypothetical protein